MRNVSLQDVINDQNWRDYAQSSVDQDKVAIANVSITLNSFVIAGDHTSHCPAGFKFMVRGSTGNDAQWTVDSVVYDGENTTVSVTGDITDPTVDGYIYFTGALAKPFTLV
jgi:hypothetical protein